MPPPPSPGSTAPSSPERESVDALIDRTRRLRGDVAAVRREAAHDDGPDDPHVRWQRALCELAVHQLDDLDGHLGQLREGLPHEGPEETDEPALPPEPVEPQHGSLLSRVGSAEWNLLTDEVTWSPELCRMLGRDPGAPALSLDELPSLVVAEDQPMLTAMVTDCLIEAKPIDGSFRILRADGTVRTLHMMGEPVLHTDGTTASMWAVLRDVTELRRSRHAVRESQDTLQQRQYTDRAEHRLAIQLQEAVLPPWRGSLRFPHGGPHALDLAAHYLPSSTGALVGGDWYDALELPDGETLLSVGDLTGHGVDAASGMAMLLGAVRGMAVAGARPGALMGWLNQLLDSSVQPVLGSALCCRYDPRTRVVAWAQAGHPAPLLFRNGTGRALTPPEGVLLGATSGAVYGQAEETLLPGDLFLLATDGLAPRRTPTAPEHADGSATEARLLALAPHFDTADTAQDCLLRVVEEFGSSEREDDACVLIARIGS